MAEDEDRREHDAAQVRNPHHMPPHLAATTGFVADEFRKWLVRIILAAILAVILWVFTPFAEQAREVWQSPARFDKIEAQQGQIIEEFRGLRDDVARATGEDRVIRQPAGRSYIKEPVKQGENVVMIMVAERTSLGRDCRLERWVPIFTDERNIPTPGQRAAAGPIGRQLDEDLTVLRIEMIPPETLIPGRVTVYLSLSYRCGDRFEPDVTDTLAYQLLPAD